MKVLIWIAGGLTVTTMVGVGTGNAFYNLQTVPLVAPTVGSAVQDPGAGSQVQREERIRMEIERLMMAQQRVLEQQQFDVERIIQELERAMQEIDMQQIEKQMKKIDREFWGRLLESTPAKEQLTIEMGLRISDLASEIERIKGEE